MLDPRMFADKPDLYGEWCTYATDNNFHPGTPEKFFEALYAAGGGLIKAGRPYIRITGKDGKVVENRRINACMGIDLLPPPPNPHTAKTVDIPY
jgi:hypothetical protein